MKADRKLMEEAIRRFLSNRYIENRMVAEAILFFQCDQLFFRFDVPLVMRQFPRIFQSVILS